MNTLLERLKKKRLDESEDVEIDVTDDTETVEEGVTLGDVLDSDDTEKEYGDEETMEKLKISEEIEKLEEDVEELKSELSTLQDEKARKKKVDHDDDNTVEIVIPKDALQENDIEVEDLKKDLSSVEPSVEITEEEDDIVVTYDEPEDEDEDKVIALLEEEGLIDGDGEEEETDDVEVKLTELGESIKSLKEEIEELKSEDDIGEDDIDIDVEDDTESKIAELEESIKSLKEEIEELKSEDDDYIEEKAKGKKRKVDHDDVEGTEIAEDPAGEETGLNTTEIVIPADVLEEAVLSPKLIGKRLNALDGVEATLNEDGDLEIEYEETNDEAEDQVLEILQECGLGASIEDKTDESERKNKGKKSGKKGKR